MTFDTLPKESYRQIAAWEHDLPANPDWERYEAEMSRPDWWHYGLYNPDLVGAVSLELIDPKMAAYHVVTARRRIKPWELADVCLGIAGELFRTGFTAVVAHNPVDKRAGARLAIRCGMREWGHTPTTRYFVLTKAMFDRR